MEHDSGEWIKVQAGQIRMAGVDSTSGAEAFDGV